MQLAEKENDPRHAVTRRKAPHLVIVDELGTVVYAREDMPLEASALRQIPMLLAELAGPKSQTAVALVGPAVALRATRMNGRGGTCYAIFREEYEPRNVMLDAQRRYGLSARECQVIELLMSGKATSEIALVLCIAPSTVQAHVKNIARKTDSRKRTEVLAKVLGVTSERLSLA